MASILIRTPRRLMGYRECDACAIPTPVSDSSAWPTANTCGPGTVPYQMDGGVVCLPEDAVSGYPKLPYVDINGWRMAQVNGQGVVGPTAYRCGPGSGQVTLGPNVACTPGGAALAFTGDGRVVLAAGDAPGQVVIPQTSSGIPVMDTSAPTTGAPIIIDANVSGDPGSTVYVDPVEVQKVANSSGVDAQSVVDQITDIANSPEAAAVAASVQDQVQRNPIPFLASLAGGWYKGFWGAMIFGTVAYFMTKPKVQIAVDATGASLVVDAQTAAHASQIAANSGTSVNVAGYFAGW